MDKKENAPTLSANVNELEKNNDFIAFSSDSDSENEEQTDKVTQDSAPILNTDYPWIIDHDHSKEREIADWLTMEIKDFVAYISPNRKEIESRNTAIDKLRSVVKELWDDADLQVFGSYATDLYLPGSDLDCVVNTKSGNKGDKKHLYSLATFLKEKIAAKDVEVVAHTRVPIIKFIEPNSNIHIDISFERTNGLEAAKLIRSWLETTPGLRELVLIIKQFLHARRLNNVRTGGLGGFSIICLVYSFLHLHPRILTGEIDATDNLGVLLIEFFELYGKNYGYDHIAIAVNDKHPSYISKQLWKDLQPARTTFALAIQDPGDPTNNISRGSFNIGAIKRAFAGGFDLLTNRCFEMHSIPFKARRGKSILGNVIQYRGIARDFHDERSLVTNKAIAESENYYRKRVGIVYDNEEDNNDKDSNVNSTTTNSTDNDTSSEPLLKKAKVAKDYDSESSDNDYNPLDN
ncbi:hypothetical protein TBLA_0B08530 [Henningerozyma blattae CBS 6284]|uniref:polynucleotide adenylyltransferase n=1 Tax=Henningerozyma blattae (strain ATCC 34711 / CBS 6284 / DSM 70876 / NBRC 10599 / NRRL Y-10934 / UCD 77-7) TaxID=1071380 RepID=I2GZW6_HENB6|nr:hypothetical protein TBLA_0B08530 [Tetrapisispora blattae CBS 6284]CCH59668.1 hypothetical protein TBLA_0B08530 [Tetrapisispora blattae CBS 6284]